MDEQRFKQISVELGVGHTPLIPYEEDFDADIYIKNEAMNASGSVKDRAALCMILDAEERGILHKGDIIVEATSGNMGISLAYVGLKLGYRVVLTMPIICLQNVANYCKAWARNLCLPKVNSVCKAQ